VIKKWFRNIGPGTLVAAAFIGPGTVTLCTLAGVNFGFTLLWAMLISVIATLVLQEMAARLGIISQKGLAESIRNELKHPVLRTIAIVLMLSAIVIGNAAYEAGNISGGILGLETIYPLQSINLGDISVNPFSLLIGFIAFIILYIGNYKFLERVLVTMVVFMSLSFLTTAIMTKPDLSLILKGFIPQFPDKSLLTIIGLIGTTVVPYNLFLHAALVKEKWKGANDLKFAQKDAVIAIVLGGIVSMSIMIAASAIKVGEINNAADLALSLEPLFGVYSKYFLAVGLFAAGITSAITAPLAAAYVTAGCLGWSSDLKSRKFRAVWIVILCLGVILSSIGLKSITIIKFAQIANGILLPVIAGFLLWIVNKKTVLGNYRNSKLQNVMGWIILGLSLFLGIKSIFKVLNII